MQGPIVDYLPLTFRLLEAIYWYQVANSNEFCRSIHIISMQNGFFHLQVTL